MQAYHQHLASLTLPNVNNATSNLLITSQQTNSMHEHHDQQSGQQQSHQHQHHHQQQQQAALSASYQNLVKPYLTNMGANCLTNGPLAQHKHHQQQHHHHHQQQQQQQLQSFMSPISATSVASFVAKLLSLDKHQLQCVDTDHEIMTHINKVESLMETRLKEINSKSSPMLNAFDENGRRLSNQQHSLNMEALALHNQRQQAELLLQQQQPQPQHQPHLTLQQHNNYYNNLYAKQLALNQYAHLQQQQQQLMFMPSSLFGNNESNSNVESSNTNNSSQLASKATIGQQQHHQATSNLTVTTTAAAASAAATPLTSNSLNHQNNSNSSGQQPTSGAAPALDLRTTPTRLSLSASPSPINSRNTSTSSLNNAANSRQSAPLPPKKMQSSEYKKMQQQLAEQQQHQAGNSLHDHNNHNQANSSTANGRQYEQAAELNAASEICNEQNRDPATAPPDKRASSGKRSHQDQLDSCAASGASNGRSSIRQQQQQQQVTKVHGGTVNAATGKRYKGEFDEPTPSEVAQREQQLKRPLYHESALSAGECACVIGSQFSDKSPREAIEMLEGWRSMKIENRIKWKWAESDLPEDIPTSKIKEIEDLRSNFSNGRADFGGASKRKPLSIRGTRQFLLMLYCLWGHPGKEDAMQKEGYCPHCFAKIRSDNDQSTLVRVVNHFNMKHKRGANPRLSPHLDSRNSPQPAQQEQMPMPSPHSHQVVDILTRVLENAVAAVDEEESGVLDHQERLQSADEGPSAKPVVEDQADETQNATETSEQMPKKVKIESDSKREKPLEEPAGAQDQDSSSADEAPRNE